MDAGRRNKSVYQKDQTDRQSQDRDSKSIKNILKSTFARGRKSLSWITSNKQDEMQSQPKGGRAKNVFGQALNLHIDFEEQSSKRFSNVKTASPNNMNEAFLRMQELSPNTNCTSEDMGIQKGNCSQLVVSEGYEEDSNQVLQNMTYLDLTVRWIQKSDMNKDLLNLQPINQRINAENLLDSIEQLKKVTKKVNSRSQVDEYENYMTIVIIHQSKVIGTGSIFIRKCGKQTPGNIGQIMLSKNYPSNSQVLHRILQTLENVAWAEGCTHTILQTKDFENHKDNVQDLDYFINKKGEKTYYCKLNKDWKYESNVQK